MQDLLSSSKLTTAAAAQTRFAKPRVDAPPSRYLFVSGIGAALESITAERIVEYFSRFGALDSQELPDMGVELVAGTRYCFLCFADIESAVRAVTELGGGAAVEEFDNIKIYVRYTVLNVPNPNPSPDKLIECVSTSDDIEIEGLHVIPDFITEEEESILLSSIGSENSGAWLDDLLTRRVQHYGFIFNYRTLMLDYATRIDPIPPETSPHVDKIQETLKSLYSSARLTEKSSILTESGGRIVPGGEIEEPLPLTQLTVNEYYPGQGIAGHIDTESCLGPDIAVISLSSGVTMTMQYRKHHSLLLKSTKASQEPVVHALKSKEAKPKVPPTPPKFKDRGERKRLKKLLKKGILPAPSEEGVVGSSSEVALEGDELSKDEVEQGVDGPESSSTVCNEDSSTELALDKGEVNKSNNDNFEIAATKNESIDTNGSSTLASTTSTLESDKIDVIKKHVWLPRRSLLILRGEARYFWSHQIAPRKFDRLPGLGLVPRERRVSLTFRQVLLPNSIPSCRLISSKTEADNVFNVYDSIAVHWNHTRGKRKVHWHKVKDFIEGLEDGSLVADVGSGDGKYFGVNPRITVIGCDRSIKLLEVSKEDSHNTFCCDAVKLPLRSESFDASLCIAVLHHLASVDRRAAVIRELLRITRPGGSIMIQAWAQEQESGSRFQFDDPNNSDSQDIFVPWKLNEKYVIPDSADSNSSSSKNTSGAADVSNSASDKAPIIDGTGPDDKYVVFQRYCHVYKKGELEDLCSSIPGNRIVECGWDKGNWFIHLEKVRDDRLSGCRFGPVSAIPTLATRLNS